MILIEKTQKGRFFTLLGKLLKVRMWEFPVDTNTGTRCGHDNWVKVKYDCMSYKRLVKVR